MSRVTCGLSISADGYSAGHNQTEKRPFGDDGGNGWGNRLHAWMFQSPEENRSEVSQMTEARAYVTHYPRDPQPMIGGTTFYFVTEGIESALNQAREAAGDGDVSIQGGARTINEYLAVGLIDELRLHIVPLTLGAGSRLIRRRPAAESRAGGVADNPLGHTCHLPRAALS
jgi:hypothetical protein